MVVSNKIPGKSNDTITCAKNVKTSQARGLLQLLPRVLFASTANDFIYCISKFNCCIFVCWKWLYKLNGFKAPILNIMITNVYTDKRHTKCYEWKVIGYFNPLKIVGFSTVSKFYFCYNVSINSFIHSGFSPYKCSKSSAANVSCVGKGVT